MSPVRKGCTGDAVEVVTGLFVCHAYIPCIIAHRVKRKFSLRRPEGRQPVLRPRSHVDPCRITHIFLACFRCNFGSNWKYQSKEKRNKKSRKFRAPDRDPSPRGKDRKRRKDPTSSSEGDRRSLRITRRGGRTLVLNM